MLYFCVFVLHYMEIGSLLMIIKRKLIAFFYVPAQQILTSKSLKNKILLTA